MKNLEMRRLKLSWIIQVCSKYHHKCLYKIESQGDYIHTDVEADLMMEAETDLKIL